MTVNQIIRALFAVLLFVTLSCETSDPEPGFELTKESGNIQTIAGLGPDDFGYDGDDGLANKAKVGWITGIALDNAGNIYITDGAANTIRKIDASNGKINTIGGQFRGFNSNDPTPYAGDGEDAKEAHLNIPMATSIDPSGTIFITDAGNNVIRKITAGKIYTHAGQGSAIGYEGDGGPATSAMLYNPNGVAVDADGNIYFADSQNNVIRKVTKANGMITTVAGLGPDNAGYSGDNGPATEAKLNLPQGVTLDEDGNIYIADSGNNVIRKISGGIITTIAGTGSVGYAGDGGPSLSATFSSIHGVAIDREGNLFVADAGNNAIRKIDSSGMISTYAGNGSVGYGGDGGQAIDAQLSNPWGVAVDGEGNLYIADTNNSAIRFVAK